jgi:two-component system, cell cycle sensor histidine kinase and response regulator CckA
MAMPGDQDTAQREASVLHETDASYRTFFVNNPQPKWIFDVQTLRFLEVNASAIRHYGYSRAEFLRMAISDIRPAEDVAPLEAEVARSRQLDQSQSEWRHRTKDGALIYVDVLRQSVVFRGREAKLVMLRDITKQKQAEEALRHAERKYRLIFEEAIVGIYQSTPDGRILSANPAMLEMFGLNPGEEMTHFTDVQTQVYVDPARRNEFKRVMAEQGIVRHFEAQVYRKDGSKMWVSVNGRAVRDGDSIVHYEGSLEDVTQRKELADRLLVAQDQYREIVNNAAVGIFQSTPEGRYLTVNAAMAKMMGYDSPSELITHVENIAHQLYVDPKRREELRRVAQEQGVVHNFECELYRKDGSRMWISANVRAVFKDGLVVRYEGMNEDITQRKQLEDQLRQALKMEAVGQLAGGVAHDFNNALAVITGYSDLLQMSLPSGSASHRHAEEIAKAGRRAAALTRQLLAFSRKQVIQPIVLDLNTATHELEKMLRRLIGENIEITFLRDPDLGRVKMDPGQVEQVLMNLCVNARDAMPTGGHLRVETPGLYVMLSVSDSGCGMTPETEQRIFEPFFTTKDPGKGTGLGLSTVYGIAKQNNGYIIVDSEIEKGTTFRLYLPRLGENAQVTPTEPIPQSVACGTETVMVVEDEEALRVLVRTCLESNGYVVLDAPNAAAALQLAELDGRKIDLLLTDMVMPGMSGRALANRMLVLHRQAKVLFMSGYSSDLLDQQRTFEPSTELLEKPFTLLALLNKVCKVLHGTGKAEAARSGE